MAKPLEIKVEVDDKEFRKYMADAEQRGRNLRPFLAKCGIVMFKSLDANFKAEGRPKKWKSLAPSTIAGRRKQSKRILQDTGRLRMSGTPVLSEISFRDFSISVMAGAINVNQTLYSWLLR